MKYATLLLALLVFALPHSAHAAWAAIDNMESYSVGGLNGGAGGSGWSANWSIDALYLVQTLTVYEGANSISVTSAATEPIGGRAVTGVAAGIMHLAMRADLNGNDQGNFFITEGGLAEAQRVAGVAFIQDGSFHALGAIDTTLSAYNADQWYTADLEFDVSTDQFRISIDGGTYSSWIDFRTTETTIDGLWIQFGQTAGGPNTFFFDDIRDGAVTAVTPKGNPALNAKWIY